MKVLQYTSKIFTTIFYTLFAVQIVVAILIYFLNRHSIINVTSSPYGNIWTYETINTRCMSFDHPSIATSNQTCMYLNKQLVPEFQYYKMLLSSLYIQNQPKNILMLGLGGGMLVRQLNYLLPKSKIDAVEINPEVVKVAKDFFYFEETENIKVSIEDGYDYVINAHRENKKYDLIIIDVSSNHTVLQKILSTTFFQMVKNITNDNGAVAVNICFNDMSYTLKPFFDVFSNAYSLVDYKNHVLLAKMDPLATEDIIEENANNWSPLFKRLEIDQKWLLSKMKNPVT